MRCFDVFNGDADGICALRQLRLAEPLESTLVTGLKREIELLKDVPARRGDRVTVLDISLDRNRAGLETLLALGAQVRYFDHHFAGPIPKHPNLVAVIDESGTLCTSALVDRHLLGRFRAWAVAGAFGDNLPEAALELAEQEPVIARLTKEREIDLHRALASRPARSSPTADAFVLPDAPWSRRVSGTFANRLSLSDPQRAHAVLTPAARGGYSVSVRSPRGNGLSAVDFCRRFATGGGRALAAGIDRLDPDRLDSFLDEFSSAWQVAGAG